MKAKLADKSVSNIEVKLFTWIEDHVTAFFLAIVFLVGICLRIVGWNFESDDYVLYLSKWYEQLAAAGGLAGIGAQVGNYNMPYQFCIAIMTYLPIDSRSAYKLFSCVFDVVLAISAMLLVLKVCKSDRRGLYAVLAFGLVFVSPVVVMNSAFWAQCDSIYVSFCLLSLAAFSQKRYVPCFILYGVAFAFKLQAVFLLPFYLIACIRTKEFSVLHFLIVPAVMVVMSLPCIIAGRSPADLVSVYMGQAGLIKSLYFNYPSFWSIFGLHAAGYKTKWRFFAIGITFVLLLAEALYLMAKRVDITEKLIVPIAATTVFTAVLFLPAMHERYMYLGEVLLIVACFIDKRFSVPAVLAIMATMGTYIRYLFEIGKDVLPLQALAVVNLVAFALTLYFTYDMIRRAGKEQLQTGE